MDSTDRRNDNAVMGVTVDVVAVLGRATMPIEMILKLGRGAVVELNQRMNEPIELFVANELVAYGEVIVIEDKLGVAITEIVVRQ